MYFIAGPPLSLDDKNEKDVALNCPRELNKGLPLGSPFGF
jgi:hypothetical protein